MRKDQKKLYKETRNPEFVSHQSRTYGFDLPYIVDNSQ